MPVKPENLLEIVEEVLELLGVSDYSDVKIISAFKYKGVWRVNFSFSPYMALYRRNGCCSINIASEDIVGMWLDRQW